MAPIMTLAKSNGHVNQIKPLELSFLDADQVKRIDHVLAEMGDFGEVRLVKYKGKLRFLQKLESEEIGGSRRGLAE